MINAVACSPSRDQYAACLPAALPFDSCFFVWDWVFTFLIALLQLMHGVEINDLLNVFRNVGCGDSTEKLTLPLSVQ